MAHRTFDEAHDQEESKQLVPSLVYDLPYTAPYVNGAIPSTFHASNNKYTTTGIKLISTPMFAPNGYLVGPSLKNYFKVTNVNGSGGASIKFLSYNPAIFFSRFRLTFAGMQAQDMVNYNHDSLMFNEIFNPYETKLNHAIEGLSVAADGTPITLAQGQSKICSFLLPLVTH